MQLLIGKIWSLPAQVFYCGCERRRYEGETVGGLHSNTGTGFTAQRAKTAVDQSSILMGSTPIHSKKLLRSKWNRTLLEDFVGPSDNYCSQNMFLGEVGFFPPTTIQTHKINWVENGSK